MKKVCAALVFCFVFWVSLPALSIDSANAQNTETDLWVEDPPEVILPEVVFEQKNTSAWTELTDREKIWLVSSGLWVLAGILAILLVGYIRATGRKRNTISA